MSDAFIGHGTLLQRGDGGDPETFTTVAEVLNISGPSLSRDTIDVTTMDSPDEWIEFIAGLNDVGEITFDLVYDSVYATIEPVSWFLWVFVVVPCSVVSSW